MRKSTLQRATALLIGAGALLAATTTGASATTASEYAAKAQAKADSVVRTMPKATTAKTAKSAPAGVAAAAAPISAHLGSGQKLEPGYSLSAGHTTLAMQWDGNLVLYLVADNGTQIKPLWSSNTYGNWGSYALMQTDGNFVVYKQNMGPSTGGATWHSGTWNNPGAFMVMNVGAVMVGTNSSYQPLWDSNSGYLPAKVNGQYTDQPRATLGDDLPALPANTWVESDTTMLLQQADGNLVLYRKSDGAPIWATYTYGHPGAVSYVAEDGEFLILDEHNIFWSTRTDGNYGAYLVAQSDGNVVLYKRDGGPGKGGALWNSGTWGKA